MTSNKSSKSKGRLPWTVMVTRSEIQESGKKLDIAADEATRAEIARIAGLRSLPRLQATFDIARYGAEGLRVDGEVSATVIQDCVVTLEPVESEIREEINLTFAPSSSPLGEDEDEEIPDVMDLDEPEPMVGGALDIGALATEFFIMGIDPYPRKPGATFEPPAADDESPHPFAALSALKKRPDNKE